MKSKLLIFALSLLTVSCASNQKSRVAATLLGALAGGAVGAATAPKEERTELHALYWAGLTGIASSVVANYYFNDERDIEMMRLENDKLKSQLDFFQSGPSTLLKETAGPADRKFFSKGKARIKLYKIDQWVDEGPDKKYHRDQMIEISPLEKADK